MLGFQFDRHAAGSHEIFIPATCPKALCVRSWNRQILTQTIS